MLAVCASLLRGATHVVLTGRPANFEARHFPRPAPSPRRPPPQVRSRPFHPRTCARGPDEVDDAGDSALALRSAAAHLRRFARAHGCGPLRLYDGGSAPAAPVAHAEHVAEYLFGRADLAGGAVGAAVATADYRGLLAELDGSADRRGALAAWLAADADDGALEPLANVAEATRGAASVDVLVGGPMTALNALATSDPDFAGKIAHVRAMAAAWDCSTANLFANQFNCAADLGAAAAALGPGGPLGAAPVTLYTTEFCKGALSLSPAEVRARAAPPVAALYDLWHDLTGGRGAVTLFDVAPLLDLVAPPLAPTVPVACALRSDGVFAITEVAESRVRATRRVLSAEDAAAAKGKLLDLLANAALAAL